MHFQWVTMYEEISQDSPQTTLGAWGAVSGVIRDFMGADGMSLGNWRVTLDSASLLALGANVPDRGHS